MILVRLNTFNYHIYCFCEVCSHLSSLEKKMGSPCFLMDIVMGPSSVMCGNVFTSWLSFYLCLWILTKYMVHCPFPLSLSLFAFALCFRSEGPLGLGSDSVTHPLPSSAVSLPDNSASTLGASLRGTPLCSGRNSKSYTGQNPVACLGMLQLWWILRCCLSRAPRTHPLNQISLALWK